MRASAEAQDADGGIKLSALEADGSSDEGRRRDDRKVGPVGPFRRYVGV